MNTLQVVQKIPYWSAEFDVDGNPSVDAGDSVAVTVDNGTVVPDAAIDPAKLPAGTDPTKVLQTGFVVPPTTPGQINVTSTFTHTDGTPAPPPVTAQLDVLVGPPATGAMNFGAPVAQ
jgi:hypothetical protein